MDEHGATLLGEQEPTYRYVPPGAVGGWGQEAVELAESIGLHADPGQQDIVRSGLSTRVTGKWLSTEVADIEPRQNGKSVALEIRALAGLFLVQEPLIVWTAHEFKTAMQGFGRMKQHIDNWDHLRKRVKAIRTSTHATEIQMMYGGVLSFLARSGGSGRGFAGVSPLFLDEAFAMTSEQMAALMFAISAADNPQVWYASSAPLVSSDVLRPIVKRGRKGAPGMTYYEWCARDKYPDIIKVVQEARERVLSDEPVSDKLWGYVRQANRAFNLRIDAETIRRELRSVPPEQFARERLGSFSDLEDGGRLDPDKWGSTTDELSHRAEGADIAIFVDIDVNREWASIAMFSMREDLLGHVQIIDHRPGVFWLADRIAEIKGTLKPLCIGMGRGTHASLKEALLDRGIGQPADFTKDRDPMFPIERGDLIVLNGVDMAAACGRLIDAVQEETLRHVPHPALDRAASKAQTRIVGDTIKWVQTDTSVNLTALIAATGSVWAYDARIATVPDDYDPLGDIHF